MNAPLILHINTALNDAYVAVSKGNEIIASMESKNPFDHASFVQPAIQDLCKQLGISLKDFSAISNINGPGSYTGLRVGLASAKGICYALNIPLICINTLDWLAMSASNSNEWICPMIDARRMEVFTALYDQSLNQIIEPTAMILHANSFHDSLSKHRIVFLGNGSAKWKSIVNSNNAIFLDNAGDMSNQMHIAEKRFSQNKFDDIAYIEPFYTKAFYSTSDIMKK